MIVILPKDRVDVSWPNFPLFFLAGPVLGGGDWQYEMCKLLEKETLKHDTQVHGFYVAVPCRYPAGHPLREHQRQEFDKGSTFERQLDWERYYLDLAPSCTRYGKIIFWLGRESKTEPRNDGNPYARDTYGELGEWRGRMMYDISLRSRVIIGAEEGFPGLDQIRRNFSAATGKVFPIYSTMQEVVRAACR